MRSSRKFQRGEITTIVALGTMAFILVTSLATSLISKKPQTTSTKASGCTTGTQTSGSTSQTCSTICGSYSNYVPNSQWTSGTTRYCCCRSSTSGGGGGSTQCDGYNISYTQCLKSCSGSCVKCPTDSSMAKCGTTSGACPYTIAQAKGTCGDGNYTTVGCATGTYKCTTTTGATYTPEPTSSTNSISCTPLSCSTITCATNKSRYYCLTGGKYYSCSSSTKGSCSQQIYSANDYCGCYSGVTPADGKCCTISDLCGSASCKDNEKYVRKYPSVSVCTGAYTECPLSGVNWHTERDGCVSTSSCGGSGSSTSGCSLTNKSCSSGSGTYNEKKNGTGTNATYTYYPSSNTGCSGNGYDSIAAACSQNKTSPIPSNLICGSSGCVTKIPTKTPVPTGKTTSSTCSNLGSPKQCLSYCNQGGNNNIYYQTANTAAGGKPAGYAYYNQSCNKVSNIDLYCGCGTNLDEKVSCVNPNAKCYRYGCPLIGWTSDGTVCHDYFSSNWADGKCCIPNPTKAPLVEVLVTPATPNCKTYSCLSACQSMGYSNSDIPTHYIYSDGIYWYFQNPCYGNSVTMVNWACKCNVKTTFGSVSSTIILEESTNGNCPLGKSPFYNVDYKKLYCK